MDVDMINSSSSPSSSAEDHMDMMTMMMQMEKLPEFCNDPNFHTSEIHFSNNGTNVLHTTPPPIYPNPNPNVISSSLMPNSTLSSFIGHNPNVQEPKYPFNANAYPVSSGDNNNNKKNSMATMREMIFRIAAMQPIHIDPESIKPPKRRNVKISKDPQSVAARHRRERISERIRILQRLVPGGTKMDTASMLDEAIHYVKFLKRQVQSLEQASAVNNRPAARMGVGFSAAAGATLMGNVGYSALVKANCQPSHHHHQIVGNMQMLR